MSTSNVWTDEELAELDAHDEVQIASVRADGTITGGRTIWAVRLGEAVYVRSVNGADSAWFRATRARHEGRLRVGRATRDVTFLDIDGADAVQERIDAAYADKYRNYAKAIVEHINGSPARATPLKLVPR